MTYAKNTLYISDSKRPKALGGMPLGAFASAAWGLQGRLTAPRGSWHLQNASGRLRWSLSARGRLRPEALRLAFRTTESMKNKGF